MSQWGWKCGEAPACRLRPGKVGKWQKTHVVMSHPSTHSWGPEHLFLSLAVTTTAFLRRRRGACDPTCRYGRLSQSCLDPAPQRCTFHLSYCLVPVALQAQDISYALCHFAVLVAMTLPYFLAMRTKACSPFLKLKSLNPKVVNHPVHINELSDVWACFTKFAKCTSAVVPSIFATSLSLTNSQLWPRLADLTLDQCLSS